MLKKNLLLLVAISILLGSGSMPFQNSNNTSHTDPPFTAHSTMWIDSVFKSLTLEEKIGQLFMVAVHKTGNYNQTDNLIKKYNIGGVIYFKNHPTKIAELTNRFQSISKIPIMTAIDGEWGLAMRLDSVESFPQQLMLGAIQDNRLIYEMGKEIAHQCQTIGININFAPVVDINNNPMNPIIGVRSFGEDKRNVTQKAYYYALGMQDNNVLAVAKHFPGHGDTDTDSHKALPVITASADRLDTLELFPFKQLINNGIGGVMIAHLYVPALDNTKKLPSSLSPKIINDLLIKEMNFKGLVFTDALGMQGVAKYHKTGEVEIKALKAGVDVLLMSKDVPKAFQKIIEAVKKGEIDEKIIDQKVLKILRAKYWLKLNKFKPIDTKNIYEKLNTPQSLLVNRKLVEAAITIIKNEQKILPFNQLQNTKFASISIGSSEETTFQEYLQRYTKIDNYNISKNASANELNLLKIKLKQYDYIIIGIHDTRKYAVKTYGITSTTINFINNLANSKKIVLNIFAPPYAVKRFKNLQKIPAIIINYEDSKLSQELSAQIIFGGIKAKGKLPVSVSDTYKVGKGLSSAQIRLKYSIPAEVKINYQKLKQIDTLIYSAIAQKAFPGCQIMAIKDGTVFLQKSYGYHTYKMQQKVKWDDIYDIASVTKVAATVPALMKLHDNNKFDVNKHIADYLPQLNFTNKKYVKIIDVLTHQAGLTTWLPFYKKALDKNWNWKPEFLSKTPSEKYCVKVSENVYTTKELQKIIYERIYNSDISTRKKYKYSDLGFYLFKQIIEQITQQRLDKYIDENFYKSLGANLIGYNPLDRNINKNRIPPTEYDYRFRKGLIKGYVHDYGASILDGVGGHAGVFSNTNDLAKLFQMLLQNGKYAQVEYLSPETINKFTTRPFQNSRRALGFDGTTVSGKGPACRLSSYKSFGHTGFTGCMVWADPQYDFIYIFLSNRVYPAIENKKITELNIRENVQSLLYQSFLYYTK